jgi:hypothetical protein
VQLAEPQNLDVMVENLVVDAEMGRSTAIL